ncbi:hypothetical protein Tco_0097540 [Tanacetum coccineum]
MGQSSKGSAENREKNKLCKADLEGPTFNLVKAFHKNIVFLQYQMDECHKLLTNKVDLGNPEGHQILQNIYEPLPLGDQPGQGMETRKCQKEEQERSKDFITAIEKRLQIRRIFRSLESFVGGRIRDIDYRLINRTTACRVKRMVVVSNEYGGNPARAQHQNKLLVRWTVRCEDILKMEMEMEIPSVKASANSDVMYFFTSAQDGDPLQDDVRLCLGDDLKKAQDHSQRQAGDLP